MQRRNFTPDTKLRAAREVLAGRSIRVVAQGLEVHANLLRRWVRAYEKDGEDAFSKRVDPETAAERELRRLRREIAILRAERDELASGKPTPEKTSVTKSMLLDATEKIMVDEGYASVSTRAVAKRIGVTPALVHYYFPTTDDLLLAAFRRKKENHDDRVRAALASSNPIRALWNFYTDQERNALGMEFRALSNHRKAILSELTKDIEESRREQVKGIADFIHRTGMEGRLPTAVCLVMLIVGMGRGFVGEEVMGVSYGHAETKAFIEGLLSDVDRLVALRGEHSSKDSGRLGRRRKAVLVD